MSGNKENKILRVMELSIKFIGKLSDEQLDGIISGNLKFDIKDKKKRKMNSESIGKIELSKEEKNNFIEIVNIIKESTDRDEAIKYIRNLKFTNQKLILLGQELGIKIPKSYKKEKIIYIIVEEVVGNKLKIEGLRKGIIG